MGCFQRHVRPSLRSTGTNGPPLWDAVWIAPDSVAFDMRSGTFRLMSPTTAVFTRSDGRLLQLVRHDGAKKFGLID